MALSYTMLHVTRIYKIAFNFLKKRTVAPCAVALAQQGTMLCILGTTALDGCELRLPMLNKAECTHDR